MKKILSFIFALTLIIFASLNIKVNANTNYRFDAINREVNYVHGLEHQRVNGTMIYGDRVTSQYYNYLNFSNSTNENYHIVAVDGYNKNKYTMQNMEVFIDNFEQENPHLEVLAGVNGDFYHINTTGQSLNTHIKNFEVYTPGANDSVALVTDENGNNSFREVTLDGHEVIVYNLNGEIKYRNKVNNLNKTNITKTDLSLYFDNYKEEISTSLSPIFVKTDDLKLYTGRVETHFNLYSFAKGNVVSNINESKIPKDYFVIINEELSNLIEEGDSVTFQSKIKNFEDVQYAVSTNKSRGELVVNGQVKPAVWDEAHPRTAIGLKENGDVVVIVVDGRDRLTPKHGLYLSELAELMNSYGVKDAYNFDGGGSSTLMLRNNVESGTVKERFDVLNDLSDGRLRSLSNGFLLVKGELNSKPLNISNITSRNNQNSPSNLFIDEKNNLHFTSISSAEKYEIYVNDLRIESKNNVVKLPKFMLGDNQIKVRAMGTETHNFSDYSEIIVYRNHSDEIKSLLALLGKLT